MRTPERRPRTGCVAGWIFRAVAIALLWAANGPAWAGNISVIVLQAGSGVVLHLRGPATSVFAADPKVAEVRPASATSLFVFGVAPGHTTVAAMDTQGDAVGQYDVTVQPSDYAARAVGSALSAVGVRGVHVHPDQNGVTLSGTAATPDAAAQALAAAGDVVGKDGIAGNTTTVVGSVQVSLHVRIAEMGRSLTRELGVNWGTQLGSLGSGVVTGIATQNALAALTSVQSQIGFKSVFNLAGRKTSLDTMIDALSQDQLIRILAEPNLTTLSGEPASFLVGGEFPIPVATADNQLTVAFKQYGISLAFIPTVLSDGRINLHVRPEVSALTTQGAVSISSGNTVIQIPAITVRRADTTVELGSGQSFAIAGLLEDDSTTTGLGLPFLGDVPVLGALFRSSSFQHNQTELVIVVTPYIVRPVDTPAALELPTDTSAPPNDLERILELRQIAHGGVADRRPFPGSAGFVVE